jgi:peroxiredoxin family protein
MQTVESEAVVMTEPLRQQIEAMVDARVEALWQEKEQREADRPRKMAIIASQGTLDWAYPPLILATAAASLGWDVGIFFTFYGLTILNKPALRKLEVAPLGNPAMPMPLPMPQLVGAIPGMTPVATTMMKKKFKAHGVASIDELLEMAVDAGVRLMPCGMTAEVFGFKADDFIEAAEPMCGAAAFIDFAQDADISLFI